MKIYRGQIRVNHRAYTEASESRILNIDLEDKYATVDCLMYDYEDVISGVQISANKNTLSRDRRYKNATSIWFDEMKGWKIVSAVVSKYTLTIAFIKTVKNTSANDWHLKIPRIKKLKARRK